MKLHLVVFTTDDGEMHLDSARSDEMIAVDPGVAQRQADAVLTWPAVATIGVVIVDVPESVVLPYLSASRRGSAPPEIASRVDAIE